MVDYIQITHKEHLKGAPPKSNFLFERALEFTSYSLGFDFRGAT
jgi:hypothetical protein